jgi:hypothetical protein
MKLESTWYLVCLSALLVLVALGCNGTVASAGRCALNPKVTCPANDLGWSCTGSDTPDEITSVNKVIDSIVCASTGEVLAVGGVAYCCTSNTTTCAADPRVVCPNQCNDPTSACQNAFTGYSCMGTNRPDAFLVGDAGGASDGGGLNFNCQQGIKAYGVIQYCCGTAPIPSCVRNSSVPCMKGTLGFSCPGSGLPSETDLGMNQSRSEVPLICSLGTPDPTLAAGTDYCCYTPTAAPPGATCLQDQLSGQPVPGCQKGSSFGFACTGKLDTPDQDYPRLSCSHGSVPGANSLGLSATLFCCDFHQ